MKFDKSLVQASVHVLLIIGGVCLFIVVPDAVKKNKAESALADFVNIPGLNRDWISEFEDYDIDLEQGSRPYYTADVRKAFLDSEFNLFLVIGKIIDVDYEGGKWTTVIECKKESDFIFKLGISSKQAELILSKPKKYFAFIVKINSIVRPAFELDVCDSDIIIDSGDIYIIHGASEDVRYIGKL